MARVLRIQTSDVMVRDLNALKRLYHASSLAETVRRAVTREVLLSQAIARSSQLTLEGLDPKGKVLHTIL